MSPFITYGKFKVTIMRYIRFLLKYFYSFFFYTKSLIGFRPKNLIELLNSGSIKSILLVIAHPDDETFCSGLILASVSSGLEVSILCMTRGEGGDRGEILKEEIASIRECELKSACAVLNIKNLWFMNYVDPELQNSSLLAPEYDSDILIQELIQQINVSGANLIVTHGSTGEYNHPAHICLNLHVRKSLKFINSNCITLLTMNAWNPRHSIQSIVNYYDFPSFQLNGSTFYETRLRALKCHQTQNRVFENFSKDSLKNFIRLTEIERYCLVEGYSKL